MKVVVKLFVLFAILALGVKAQGGLYPTMWDLFMDDKWISPFFEIQNWDPPNATGYRLVTIGSDEVMHWLNDQTFRANHYTYRSLDLVEGKPILIICGVQTKLTKKLTCKRDKAFWGKYVQEYCQGLKIFHTLMSYKFWIAEANEQSDFNSMPFLNCYDESGRDEFLLYRRANVYRPFPDRKKLFVINETDANFEQDQPGELPQPIPQPLPQPIPQPQPQLQPQVIQQPVPEMSQPIQYYQDKSNLQSEPLPQIPELAEQEQEQEIIEKAPVEIPEGFQQSIAYQQNNEVPVVPKVQEPELVCGPGEGEPEPEGEDFDPLDLVIQKISRAEKQLKQLKYNRNNFNQIQSAFKKKPCTSYVLRKPKP